MAAATLGRSTTWWQGFHGAIERLVKWIQEGLTRILDLVHHVLNDERSSVDVMELEAILEGANSLYTVREDWRGLEERVPSTLVDQVQKAVATADGSVSQHLVDAWNSAYGYDKNPAHSYAEAVRAVETALRPIVCPKDHASLFKMIKLVGDAPQKWDFVLVDARPAVPPNAPPAEGVQVVLELMRLLAYGERKRHGGQGSSPSDDEAKAAVLVALTLVQLCGSGAFRAR